MKLITEKRIEAAKKAAENGASRTTCWRIKTGQEAELSIYF